MEGTFVRADGNKVTLLLKSGQLVTMSVDKFAPADQQYIRDLQASATAPAPAGTPAAGEPQPDSPQTASIAGQEKSVQLSHPPDPRVKPGAEIYVPFPKLGRARTDEPMGMRIRIPGSYRPDRLVPLLVWLEGGNGTSSFEAGKPLVDPEQFVLAGMTYPASVPEPQYATMKGQIPQIWAMHEKMLAKLQDMIPNIDPRLRVVAGFSNGAHVIGGCLAQRIDGLYRYFNVFILAEGGASSSYNYPLLPGRYFYVASGGDKEGMGRGFNTMLANYARNAGMNVRTRIMEGLGHAFTDPEKERVKEWLENEVIPAQLAKP